MTTYRYFFIENILQVQYDSSVYEVQAMENHNILVVGGSFNWVSNPCYFIVGNCYQII